MFDANDSSMNGTSVLHLYGFQMVYRSRHQTLVIDTPMHSKTEMSRAIIYEYSQDYFQPKIGRTIRIFSMEYSVWTGKTIFL